MQDAMKKNAFVLYDLKNIEMLQAESDGSSENASEENYAFDFSDDEERAI